MKYSDPTVFFIVLPGWILSVCLHEFAHAYTAFRGGDLSVKEKGYLTLNPFKYTHPLYSLGMPILFMLMGGIGLPGGAVYIHRAALRSRIWDTAVSLAGPAMNLLIAALLSVVFHAGPFIAGCSHAPSNGLAMLIQLQLSATLLNLLPVPPLDGYQAIHPWFSPPLRHLVHEGFQVRLCFDLHRPSFYSGFQSCFLGNRRWYAGRFRCGYQNGELRLGSISFLERK